MLQASPKAQLSARDRKLTFSDLVVGLCASENGEPAGVAEKINTLITEGRLRFHNPHKVRKLLERLSTGGEDGKHS